MQVYSCIYDEYINYISLWPLYDKATPFQRIIMEKGRTKFTSEAWYRIEKSYYEINLFTLQQLLAFNTKDELVDYIIQHKLSVDVQKVVFKILKRKK